MAELLTKFPVMWGVVCGTFGCLSTIVVVFLVARKYNPMQSAALTGLVAVYEKQIAANERALIMQRDHYTLEIDDMKSERDNYRQKLHDEKDAHNALVLTVAELQARPNVDKVYESQQQFFITNTKTLDAIHHSIQLHDSSIEERTKKIVAPVVAVCERLVLALGKGVAA